MMLLRFSTTATVQWNGVNKASEFQLTENIRCVWGGGRVVSSQASTTSH